MIRHLKKLAARVVNHVARRVIDGHNARTSAQSRQAVERAAWAEKTPISPRVAPLPKWAPATHRPYVVYFDNGTKRRFAEFSDAAAFYSMVKGYGLINEDFQTDGGNYAGLTEEQRGEIGL